jgi:hypothetical protein
MNTLLLPIIIFVALLVSGCNKPVTDTAKPAAEPASPITTAPSTLPEPPPMKQPQIEETKPVSPKTKIHG